MPHFKALFLRCCCCCSVAHLFVLVYGLLDGCRSAAIEEIVSVFLGLHAPEGHTSENEGASRPEEYLHALSQHRGCLRKEDEWWMRSVPVGL
ncbi:hypothetical protein B484DRAFT_456136 [Ochromonadaceae sp. CCMP2298]|nr:hypothetical protein B484DRAFT_456136 [Ochromonadaceae sp. CCMP2298]